MKSIMLKESKIRMRSWKIVGMIVSYILLLGLAVVIMLNGTIYDNYGYVDFSDSFRNVYMVITIVQVLMISFIVPILTSGSISMEREKQTLDILLSTNLRPISIVTGKLMTSISQVLLLIVASLPVFSFVFLFGGLNVLSILQMVLFYIVISFFFGALGVFFSVIFKKTITSIVLTYLVMIVLTVGTLIITLIYISSTRQYDFYENHTLWLMYLNPGVTFWAILLEQFGGLREVSNLIGGNNNYWMISTSLFAGFSVILIWVSAYILNPIKKKLKRR